MNKNDFKYVIRFIQFKIRDYYYYTSDLTWSGPQSMRSFGREQYRMVTFVRQVNHFREQWFLQETFTHFLPVEHELPTFPVEPVKCAGVVHRHVHLFRFVVALRQNDRII